MLASSKLCMRAPAVPDDCLITLAVADVSKTFKQVNIHKAAGPDGLPGRVLRACADQLASVFTDMSNLSLTPSVIPTCFKQTTIVPVPKNTTVTCLNDYCPVALTSVVMKCFERLVMAHVNTIIPDTLDPLQFAYCPNRSTDDAISIALHTALSHLDKTNTYVRMLFIDYNSGFNTIVPSNLITKLRTLGLNTSLCNWILDSGGPPPGGQGRQQQHIGTRGPLRGVCLAPSCTPCSPTTAWPHMTPTPSLSLLMTRWWSPTTMRQPTGRW